MQTYTVFEPRVGPEAIEERAGTLGLREGRAFLLGVRCARLVAAVQPRLVGAAGLSGAQRRADRRADRRSGRASRPSLWGGLVVNLIFAYEARDLYRGCAGAAGLCADRRRLRPKSGGMRAALPAGMAARSERPALPADGDVGNRRAGSGNVRRVCAGEPVIGMFPAHGRLAGHERRHYRLWLGQSAFRRESLRARGGGSRNRPSHRSDRRPGRGPPRRAHRAARRRRLRRLLGRASTPSMA